MRELQLSSVQLVCCEHGLTADITKLVLLLLLLTGDKRRRAELCDEARSPEAAQAQIDAVLNAFCRNNIRECICERRLRL